MELKNVLQYLVDNAYVLASKEKGYVLSKKFQEDVKRMKRDRVQSQPVVFDLPIVPSIPTTSQLVLTKMKAMATWETRFSKFILDAQVPRQLDDNRGNSYAANKYSEDGMKAFRKAMEENVDYGTLVRSTMLYYKSNIRYKKAIGNYFAQGDWRTDYQNLKEAAILGTKELEQHLLTETKSNEHNPYRLG